MKKIQAILLFATILGLCSCGSTITEETTENFKQVELPDSSVVYLNHNSKLTYDKKFNSRRVKLEGEAFFSVNDGQTPFVIETSEGDEITVEGTEFNLIASVNVVVVEVEIGIVSLRFATGKFYKGLRRGQRIDFGRHDNGLHLGQAKHQHRNWIRVMDKDFRKSGKILKRSNKHTVKNFQKGNGGGNKPNLKGKGDKGNAGPKTEGKKSVKPKSDGGKSSKGGDKKAGGKKDKGKN
jgi:hypothetical protein